MVRLCVALWDEAEARARLVTDPATGRLVVLRVERARDLASRLARSGYRAATRRQARECEARSESSRQTSNAIRQLRSLPLRRTSARESSPRP